VFVRNLLRQTGRGGSSGVEHAPDSALNKHH